MKKHETTQEGKIKMTFFKDEWSEGGSSNNYAKLLDGENRFRILSAPIAGWEYWVDKKPVRSHIDNCPAINVADKKDAPKRFVAMIVWDYRTSSVSILELTQVTIIRPITSFERDPDWGPAFFYDIKIHKSGTSKDTEYMVSPCPKKPLPKEVEEEFLAKKIFLPALVTNQDPFAIGWPEPTVGIFREEDLEKIVEYENVSKPVSEKITKEQAQELLDMIGTDADLLSKVKGRMLAAFKSPSITNLQSEHFDAIAKFIRESKAAKVIDVPF